ncbi:MAG: MoaD/ThiS family protein [Actinobacteria bacterium]|nr:MoaD/ThiS family protein [Actinomycetota bacterium]MBU1494277.1 MoaD/ThiS family protein [Actinomycetota bacterium]
MARLRLFANLREAAGVADVQMPGATVEEVLANASGEFGDRFTAGLASAQVWVNGNQAAPGTAVVDGDEVALIPPVSGGTTIVRSPLLMEIGLFLILALGLVGASSASIQWFAVGLVLAGGLWIYDLVDYAARRGQVVAVQPAMLGLLGGVLASYRWGIPGMASATIGAVLVALVWSVLAPRFRPIEVVATSMLVALIATFGVSAMLLLRLRSENDALAFLVVTVTAVAAAWVAGQRDISGFDPVVVTLLIGIVMGVVAASVWAEDDLLPMIVAALAASVALVAGRNVGSLLRAGGFFTVGTVPGALHGFDAIVLAAGPFWLILTIFG